MPHLRNYCMILQRRITYTYTTAKTGPSGPPPPQEESSVLCTVKTIPSILLNPVVSLPQPPVKKKKAQGASRCKDPSSDTYLEMAASAAAAVPPHQGSAISPQVVHESMISMDARVPHEGIRRNYAHLQYICLPLTSHHRVVGATKINTAATQSLCCKARLCSMASWQASGEKHTNAQCPRSFKL